MTVEVMVDFGNIWATDFLILLVIVQVRNELQLMVSKTGDLILTSLVSKPLLLRQGSPETETSIWEVNV